MKLRWSDRQATMWLALAMVAGAASSPVLGAPRTGAEIYQNLCVRCHGPEGEGVAGKSDEPLRGERSVKSLTELIERTMPENNPSLCVGEDAVRVAEYIHQTFYSAEARARLQPARVQLARLTVRQYANTVADLVGSFRGATGPPDAQRGLNGQYFDAKDFRREKRAFERVDPQVAFQWGDGNPVADKPGTNGFAIRWRGSLIADETGDHEFGVTTENGVRLWVNGESKPLIDEWVASGSEAREHRQIIRLLGGRVYPIQVDWYRSYEKSASIVLRWKPPFKTWATIPARNLSPTRVPETLIVTTPFPPDDSSVGYARGTSVSKAWDQATTHAAIEVANRVVEALPALAGVRADAKDSSERTRRFCEQFAERAFRRPLTAEDRAVFVAKQFDGTREIETAVKRSVMLVLKSPRFLYSDLDDGQPDGYDVASRLSYALWDSLPDAALLEAAAQGRLQSVGDIAAQARRMLEDPRTKVKLRDFLHHWLETERADDVTKDATAYPGFNAEVLADMRTSLELFLDEVVWSEASDFRDLLLSDSLFLNDGLAEFLGLDLPGRGNEDKASKQGAGAEFRKVRVDPAQRTGVITHPFLLTAFAYHKNSSPIHRGVFLTRNIMGRTLRPPPMAIEFMDNRFDPSLTMREKVSELTRPAACQTCHSVINPLGFSLEHFDAVGRYRTTDNQKPVDATGDYPTTEGDTVRLKGARDVAEFAAVSEEAQRGFVQQLFHHVVKQPAAAYGGGTLDDLRRAFAASEFNIRKLLANIAVRSAAHGISPAQARAELKTPRR